MDVQIPIAEFKTHCYQILDQARKANNKLIITKGGIPIAEIIPTQTKHAKKSLMGLMQGRAKINGDLLDPLDVTWDAKNE